MNRLVITLLLAAISGSAAAEWVYVSSNAGVSIYADPTTVRESGIMFKMWELSDFETAQVSSSGKAYLSAKILKEYDCQGERTRILSYSHHSGQMGSGAVVDFDSHEKMEWDPFPSSMGNSMWKFTCAKSRFERQR